MVVNVTGKGGTVIPSGEYQRRRIQVNHRERVVRTTSVIKTGGCNYPGISLEETCLLSRWWPAYRWRDPGTGFD